MGVGLEVKDIRLPSPFSLIISLLCHAHTFTHLVTHLLKTNTLCVYNVAGPMLSREDATSFNTCLTDFIHLNIQPHSLSNIEGKAFEQINDYFA